MKESELIEVARQAAQQAYCPYSKFRVGAALVAADGKVYSGCNVENASYGLTNCAERTALFKAVSEGASSPFRKLVIYTPTAIATSPCGACRQVLFEFGAEAEVLCTCDSGHEIRTTVSALLPGGLKPSQVLRP